jgi:hypothetical protein
VAPFETLRRFPSPISWLTATIVDRQLFAIAGRVVFDSRTLSGEVWRGSIGSDSQLSAFEAIDTILARERHATVLVDRTIVVIGGGAARTVLDQVEAVSVDAQGNLGAWVELPPLPEPRYAHAAFAEDGQIYVSGGFLRYGSNETSRQVFRLNLDALDTIEK